MSIEHLVSERKQSRRPVVLKQALRQDVPPNKRVEALLQDQFRANHRKIVNDEWSLSRPRTGHDQADIVLVGVVRLASGGRCIDRHHSRRCQPQRLQHGWIRACVARPSVDKRTYVDGGRYRLASSRQRTPTRLTDTDESVQQRPLRR